MVSIPYRQTINNIIAFHFFIPPLSFNSLQVDYKHIVLVLYPVGVKNRFNSLQVDYKLDSITLGICGYIKVSIPYRQTINSTYRLTLLTFVSFNSLQVDYKHMAKTIMSPANSCFNSLQVDYKQIIFASIFKWYSQVSIPYRQTINKHSYTGEPDRQNRVSIPYRQTINQAQISVLRYPDSGFNSLQVDYKLAGKKTFRLKWSSFNSLQVDYKPTQY